MLLTMTWKGKLFVWLTQSWLWKDAILSWIICYIFLGRKLLKDLGEEHNKSRKGKEHGK